MPPRGALEQRLAGQRRERRLLRGLPDQRVAADERDRGVPGPDGDREIEGADDADHAQRMPGLHHVVARPLGRDGEAVKLTRKADGEVADVDHLLHLAEAFLDDLAGLDRDQAAERGLMGAQLLAEEPHQLAAPGRRHRAPDEERLLRLADRGLELGRRHCGHARDLGAVDGAARGDAAVGESGLRHAEAAQEIGDLGAARACEFAENIDACRGIRLPGRLQRSHGRRGGGDCRRCVGGGHGGKAFYSRSQPAGPGP